MCRAPFSWVGGNQASSAMEGIVECRKPTWSMWQTLLANSAGISISVGHATKEQFCHLETLDILQFLSHYTPVSFEDYKNVQFLSIAGIPRARMFNRR